LGRRKKIIPDHHQHRNSDARDGADGPEKAGGKKSDAVQKQKKVVKTNPLGPKKIEKSRRKNEKKKRALQVQAE